MLSFRKLLTKKLQLSTNCEKKKHLSETKKKKIMKMF